MDNFSNEYINLKKRITELIRHFDFKQSSNRITSLQEDKVRALQLLCHAEYEAYFESRALSIFNSAKDKWVSMKIANKNLAALFIESEKIAKNESLETKLQKIMSDYEKIVKSNNGIKLDNLKKIFQPLGYDVENINTTLIGNLNSFGAKRGETAHTSYRTQNVLDKDTEQQIITQILEEIKDFENFLNT